MDAFVRTFPASYEAEIEPINFHLLGVAFYETQLAGKADKIICHGRRSLIDKLLPAIRAKWPDEA